MIVVRNLCRLGRIGTSARCKTACASRLHNCHTYQPKLGLIEHKMRGFDSPASRLRLIVSVYGTAKQQV